MVQIPLSKIYEIARASKAICHPEGMGNGLAVFSDGSFSIAISSNDVVARGNGHGGWEYRLTYISVPLSREQAIREIREAEAMRASDMEAMEGDDYEISQEAFEAWP